MSRKRRVASSSTAEPSAALRESIAPQHPAAPAVLFGGTGSEYAEACLGQVVHAAIGQRQHALALRLAQARAAMPVAHTLFRVRCGCCCEPAELARGALPAGVMRWTSARC